MVPGWFIRQWGREIVGSVIKSTLKSPAEPDSEADEQNRTLWMSPAPHFRRLPEPNGKCDRSWMLHTELDGLVVARILA